MTKSMKELLKDSYLSGGNIAYLDQEYDLYLQDSSLVDPELKQHFDSIRSGNDDTSHEAVKDYFAALGKLPAGVASGGASADVGSNANSKVIRLIKAYQAFGHLKADLDPLKLAERHDVPALELSHYGLSDADLDTEFDVDSFGGIQRATLRDIVAKLKESYCGTIGVEYKHISDHEQQSWLREQFEVRRFAEKVSAEEKHKILTDLTAADGMEKYLGTRYVGQKRFSLEGGDALIPMIRTMAFRQSEGVEEFVIGMAHRGRLNVLINVLGKKTEELFAEFEGKSLGAKNEDYSGDVKYHMGFSSDILTEKGDHVHLALAFNPSHLEIVSPVGQGSVRSRLRTRKHKDKSKELNTNQVVPISIHGDAAFAGQGVVMETFSMSKARGFRVGGTIHIVINNQVGFTTSNPLDARSTLYCTDIAKMVQAPVIHVNGDDPEAVVFASKVAMEYRQKFESDIVIDLVCYRRHGHNEADEPSGTQPLMYKVIKKLPALKDIYAKQLVEQGVLTQGDVDKILIDYTSKLDNGQSVIDITDDSVSRKYANDWSKYSGDWRDPVKDNVSLDKLKQLADAVTTVPEDFTMQAQVKKAYADRVKMTQGELPLNWGYGEILAYATLLDAGHQVRLTGQDAGRGTFSHRHARLHDNLTGDTHTPLRHVSKDQAAFIVIDSLLSEEAVLAFEYGFSCSEPEGLTIWEAQFGDFANGAQVVIDQFITSGEQKWGRLSGLTMLLPHGYEGQGPEHSSARLERFLQLCAQDNIQVCTPTTPAQIFHLLRRQTLRNVRKPLIIMSPKSMLRNKLAVSKMEDLSNGCFDNVIAETDALKSKKVKRVVVCGGKVYYDLLQHRRDNNIEDIALIRVEQLYPFPDVEFAKVMKEYAHVDDIVWCQEEPKNQGAWLFIRDYLQDMLSGKQSLNYVGRAAAAAPAVGSAKKHKVEFDKLMKDAFGK